MPEGLPAKEHNLPQRGNLRNMEKAEGRRPAETRGAGRKIRDEAKNMGRAGNPHGEEAIQMTSRWLMMIALCIVAATWIVYIELKAFNGILEEIAWTRMFMRGDGGEDQ